MLFVLIFFLLYPSPFLKRIAYQIQIRKTQSFRNRDTLALSLSLGIFYFAPLLRACSNFFSNLEKIIFHLPPIFGMITNLQPALKIRFEVVINDAALEMKPFFSSIGLPLVSPQVQSDICLHHFRIFCPPYGPPSTEVISKVDIVQNMANYALFPAADRTFTVYMIPLLIAMQIFHMTTLVKND